MTTSSPRRSRLLLGLVLAVGMAIGVVATLLVQSRTSDVAVTVDASPVMGPETIKILRPEASHKSGQADHSVKLAQILAANDKEFKGEDLRRLGMDLASQDVQDALKLAETIAAEKDRHHFLRGIYEVWSGTDPEAAASYAMSNFKSGELRADLVRVVLGKWGAKSAREAYTWAEANLHGPMKEQAINSLVKHWASTKPEAAAAWFAQTGGTSPNLMQAIAGAWAARDTAAATKWVESQSNKANRDNGRLAIARELAQTSPEAALAFMQPYLAGSGGNGGAFTVGDPLGKTPTATPKPPIAEVPSVAANPSAPTDTVAQNTPESATAPGSPAADPTPTTTTPDSTPDLATMLMNIWATQDPAAAAANLDKFPAGKAREEAAATLATVWAASDIHAAVGWTENITDPTLKSAVIQQLGTTWGAIEPDQAITWLNTLPAELSRNGYRGAYNSWAATDPVGLQEWIQGQSSSSQMDLARRSLGDVNLRNDPVGALDLAMGIQDAQMQAEAVSKYYSNWRKSDVTSADEWLQASWPVLPATTQGKLQKHVNAPQTPNR